MSRKIRILHLSTHNEDCGIGKYQEMFLEAMQSDEDVYNKFFEISPNQIKVMAKQDYLKAFALLKKELASFDILHIQHEYSFYWNDELQRSIDIAKSLNKKVIVTIHTSANVAHKKTRLTGLGPRSFAVYARSKVSEKRFFKRFIYPLKRADMIIVHNEVTKKSLSDRGIPENIIRKIIIPVPEVSREIESEEIKKNLNVSKGDIVYATIGFLHRFKGIKEAVKALQYLPSNYKLAIIGGLHPGTDDIAIYDKVSDLIAELGLKQRVYITGYIEDDDTMNALIRECDVCVYPYDKEYYSNVSSAALNNALANYVSVVAYPTASFMEINEVKETICLTQSFAYYELARTIAKIDTNDYCERSRLFAQDYSYSIVSKKLISIYDELSE